MYLASSGHDLAKAYASGELNSFFPELAREAFQLLVATNPRFMSRLRIRNQSRPTAGRKAMLYDFTRKLLGKDTENYRQEIGDCVSFGAKNDEEYLQAVQIITGKKRSKWRPIYPPYNYGTSRVLIGKGAIPPSEDGSTGAWMAQAAMQYGTLFADAEGVPHYSGQVAKKWGGSGPPQNFVDVGKKYLVHSTALISSWDDLVAAITNGYPCTTASNIGYDMEPSSDGFHRQTQQWGHQMCVIGVDETYKEPYAIILNSWGDVHGHITDFQDSSVSLPVGVLRVRRADMEKHIRAQETYAYSDEDGFPEEDLDKALFEHMVSD